MKWLAAKRINVSFMPTPLCEKFLKVEPPAKMSLRYVFTGKLACTSAVKHLRITSDLLLLCLVLFFFFFLPWHDKAEIACTAVPR
jgi:hypothetical protein